MATTLPPRCYVDPEFFAHETARLFRREWLCVAREDEVAAPGDFLTLEIVGEPLVVTRDLTGMVHVLSNVCRHRWLPVAVGRGSRRALQCGYHRWTYELDGSLRGAPHMENVPEMNPARCGLPRLRTETWQGWIFASFDPRATPLAPRLAGLEPFVAPYDLPTLCTTDALEYECAWNWKVLVDNFMESYHHAGIHGATLQPVVPARATWAERCQGPFSVLHNPTGDGSDLPTIFPCRPGLSTEQRREFLVCAVYPTHLFTLNPDAMVFYQLLPDRADRCRLRIHCCVPRDAAAADVEAFRHLVARIHAEDIEACRGVWRGLHSASAGVGPLSPLEWPLVEFKRYLLDRLLPGATETR